MLSALHAYPSFLVFLGAIISALLTILLTPPWIRVLKSKAIGQQVRADGPQSHLVKQGTPTMGGVVMLVAVLLACVLVAAPDAQTITLMGAIMLTGFVGLADDASKVVFERSLGLTPRQKLILQFLIATVFCLAAVNYAHIAPTVEIPLVYTFDMGALTTVLPIGEGFSIPWIYLIFVNILVVGMCNAVNLTDGLDGLAGGTVMMVMIVMALIAYRTDMLSASIVAAAIAGACVGFLWFNTYPADIFMGDTGSLAFGTALGGLAVLTKTEFLVIIIGGLYVIEALSVIIQVAYFKRTHKRIFLMAPLHHHFEKKGWSETKVVVRFWIISGLFAALGLAWFFAKILAG